MRSYIVGMKKYYIAGIKAKRKFKTCTNKQKLQAYTVVVFDPEGSDKQYPFKRNEQLLYLGEVINMRGHGIFVNEKGIVFWGYHLENFRQIRDDE
jgi:hypothetical protein